MPDLFGNKTFEEMLAERQQQQRSLFGSVIKQNMAQASSPEEVAGTGIGNFLGALGVKYFGGEAPLTPEMEAAKRRQEAQAGLSVEGSDYQASIKKLEAIKKYNQKFGNERSLATEQQLRDQIIKETQARQDAAKTEEMQVNLSNLITNPSDKVSATLAVVAGADPKTVNELRRFGLESQSKFGKMAEDLGFERGTDKYQAKVAELMQNDPEATKIINNIGGTPDAFLETLGKEQAKKFSDQSDNARTAVTSLNALNESAKLLNSGKLISGIGGDFKLAAAKLLSETGLIGTESVEATEAFFANQGRQVAEVIKAFGSGTGLSDKDREYAEKIAGGQIKLSEESLRKLISLGQQYGAQGINDYNTRAAQVLADNPEYKNVIPTYEVPEAIKTMPLKNLPTDPNLTATHPETKAQIFSVDGEWVDRFGNKIK